MNNENQNKQIENLLREFDRKIEAQNLTPETGSISVEQKLANLNFDTVLNDQEREELDRKTKNMPIVRLAWLRNIEKLIKNGNFGFFVCWLCFS